MRDIEERMPASEVTDWLAYYKLEPFGAERDNWHAAQIAAILVNTNLRKGAKPVQPADFMYVDRGTTQKKGVDSFFATLKRKATKGKPDGN